MSAEARQAALAKLKAAEANLDWEGAHGDADDALCDLLRALGYTDVVESYERVGKWYA